MQNACGAPKINLSGSLFSRRLFDCEKFSQASKLGVRRMSDLRAESTGRLCSLEAENGRFE